MEKITLSLDTGLKEYAVNNAVIRMNPTDMTTAQAIFDAMEKMGGIQAKYAAMGQDDLPEVDFDAISGDEAKAAEYAAQTQNRLDAFRQVDMELQAEIDSLFGEGTAQGVFGSMSLTAYADGLPVWLNLLLALLDQFPEAAKAQAGMSDERLKAVTARYTQKYTEMKQFHAKRRKNKK